MCAVFFLQYLDKQSLSYASVSNVHFPYIDATRLTVIVARCSVSSQI